MKETEKLLLDKYIKGLEKGEIPWKKPRIGPMNPISNTKYRAINFLNLASEAEEKGYRDPRWLTLEQVKQNNWQIKSGSKGIPVELLDDQSTPKIDYVYNASQVEGIEKFIREPLSQMEATRDYTVLSLANEIGLGIANYEISKADLEEGDRIDNFADYIPSQDVVRIPRVELFETYEDYNRTLLHQICHAIGHSSRMNLDLEKEGMLYLIDEYAKEKLRDEMASIFLVDEYGFEFEPLIIEKSQRDTYPLYVQLWTNILKNEPEELFAAIRDAEKIEKYCLEKLPVERVLEIEENMLDYQYQIGIYFKNNGVDRGFWRTFDFSENFFSNEPIILDSNGNNQIELDVIKKRVFLRKDGEIENSKDIDDMLGFTKLLAQKGKEVIEAVFPEYELNKVHTQEMER